MHSEHIRGSTTKKQFPCDHSLLRNAKVSFPAEQIVSELTEKNEMRGHTLFFASI